MVRGRRSQRQNVDSVQSGHSSLARSKAASPLAVERHVLLKAEKVRNVFEASPLASFVNPVRNLFSGIPFTPFNKTERLL